MAAGFEEADIRSGLREGGNILSAFIVGRFAGTWDDVQYVAYLRTSWRRGYHILKTRRKRSDKVYMGNGLGRLVWLLRQEFGYTEPLLLYEAGCDALQRFAGLQPVDRRGRTTDGPPRAASQHPPSEWPIHYPPRDQAVLPRDSNDGEEGGEE